MKMPHTFLHGNHLQWQKCDFVKNKSVVGLDISCQMEMKMTCENVIAISKRARALNAQLKNDL